MSSTIPVLIESSPRSTLRQDAKALLEAHPKLKLKAVAAQLGVSERTLRRALNERPRGIQDDYSAEGLAKIPFAGAGVFTLPVNGVPHVLLKPSFDHMGLDPDWYIRKLQQQHWAVTGLTPVTAGDGKRYQMITADVRTFLMGLAIIPASRVNEVSRPLLMAYQTEVADVIERYWTQGGVINPRATEAQLVDLQEEVNALLKARILERMDSRVFRDIVAGAADYDQLDSERKRLMFAKMRDNMHVAVAGAPARVLAKRREIQQWKGKNGPTKEDLKTALNYLTQQELQDEALVCTAAAVRLKFVQRRHGVYTLNDCVTALAEGVREIRAVTA